MSKKFISQASRSRVVGGFGGGFTSTAGQFDTARNNIITLHSSHTDSILTSNLKLGSTLSYLSEPPNIFTISDANVIVCFKNMTKKDGTTKSKGLEDLRTYVQDYEQDGGVEEAILEAWVKLYPRISIDNSRRVRELSHNLQYELLKSTRKRMERHIPEIVGSWLAGTYDRDRAVSRAAVDGITSFLDTDKKVAVFWKRCQVQVLSYAQEAINETPQTLSDERGMTAEDVQAKYFRVVGSSISLVLNLLDKLEEDDILKYQDKYDEFLSSNKKLWSLASCEDSFVRRTVDQLLEICVDRLPEIIEADLELISHGLIGEALRCSQSSSAFQLVTALNKVTSRFPHIWTSAYKGKKGTLSRLRHFVEKGSQGGPPAFWQTFSRLLSILPSGVLPVDVDSSLEFLKAFRDGISHREEPRNNVSNAWHSYFATVTRLSTSLGDVSKQGKLFQEAVYPIFEQYLHPTTENSKWSSGNSIAVLAKAYIMCSLAKEADIEKSFADEWQKLSDDFIQRLNTSLPEQSKDYHKSQTALVTESHRWFGLHSAILAIKPSGEFADQLMVPSRKIISTAIAAVISRNGKPFSAAAAIESALRLAPKFVQSDSASLDAVSSFLGNHLPKLIISPSSEYLISILNLFRSIPDQQPVFGNIWQSTIDGLLTLPDDDQKIKVITSLVSNDAVTALTHDNPALQDFLSVTSLRAVRDQERSEARNIFAAALTFNSLTGTSERDLLGQIIALIDPKGESISGALAALELISKMKPSLLQQEEKTSITLITKLLALTELSDSEVSSRAAKLKTIMETSDNLSKGDVSPMLHVIRENLENASPQSLTIETLIQQATSLLDTSCDSNDLLPDITNWSESLMQFLGPTPNPALGVMRPFAGAVFLIHPVQTERPRPTRDLNGYSIPLRMALYTARLVER